MEKSRSLKQKHCQTPLKNAAHVTAAQIKTVAHWTHACFEETKPRKNQDRWPKERGGRKIRRLEKPKVAKAMRGLARLFAMFSWHG